MSVDFIKGINLKEITKSREEIEVSSKVFDMFFYLTDS